MKSQYAAPTMAYAIERGESISAALPRIIIERIDTAYEQLLDHHESLEERVHNARKRFKETRAAVRLIRFAIGRQFTIENQWFRDAGRDLAALRDADAVIEATDTLKEMADGFHDRRVLRRLRQRLVRARSRSKPDELAARIANTAQQLPVSKARVTLWPALDDAFATIGDGLRRTYRDGRRATKQALAAPSPEVFHQWRKRAKDHWYHTQILRHLWPEVLKPYRAEMEKLSDALGDRHDMDVLRQTVLEAGEFFNDFDLRLIHALIDRRSAELTETATSVGQRVYADRPSVVSKRFEHYWSAWAD